MFSTNLLRHVGRQAFVSDSAAVTRQMLCRQAKSKLPNNTSVRHATTSTTPAAAYYSIPKRAVHVGIPVLIAILAILRFTDPSRAPQSVSKVVDEVQHLTRCSKTHARDLDTYIKANLDGISDEYLVAWNKMYNEYKEHRKNEEEPERIEKENARLLAQYARMEENKSRSTKVAGTMATHGGNRNISHRPETVGEVATEEAKTFRENMAARWTEAKRKFTKATKGSDMF